jgi:hypothetical protein
VEVAPDVTVRRALCELSAEKKADFLVAGACTPAHFWNCAPMYGVCNDTIRVHRALASTGSREPWPTLRGHGHTVTGYNHPRSREELPSLIHGVSDPALRVGVR